ncbi:TPA: type II toxin-antitoxin system RelE/ParE family toxin [Vibrio vulnificus]|nr:type II toxin-antitoxin system RelE/ParE family toxin [Vibrio vulnificus]
MIVVKELRVQSNGKPIRAFFAFDPERTGIILCGGGLCCVIRGN